jgi:hypothetical protein
MKIGLIAADGHNFPNLALMKISAYHKSLGDSVEWAGIGNYDITYISKVFTFTPEPQLGLGDYGEVIKGGTGFGLYNELSLLVDGRCPDYSIYPKFTAAYGFITRGCTNKCDWCIVPKKEGLIYPNSDIEDWLDGRKEAVIMDNNILAHSWGIEQLEKIAKLGIKIDINQGVEAKRITPDIAELFSKLRFSRYIRIACDTKAAIPAVEQAVLNLSKAGIKPYRIFCYVLVKDVNDALFRIEYLRKLGVVPFAQPYRDFKNSIKPNYEQKRLARWCNRKEIFTTCDFKDYKPGKGFYCKLYFDSKTQQEYFI